MPFSHFTTNQITPLYISGALLILSVVLFRFRPTVGLILLFFGTLGLGYFMANLDPFLNLWDEQYHALVAKNMVDAPFKPMLYESPVLDYDYTGWTSNHIWLHKQPLFLWQMALSIKLFGATALAVRLPSILMHAIIPLFIFRIGKVTVDRQTGYFGALLFAVAYYPLELITGGYSTDHNDLAFLFYVSGSFWAWFEYQRSEKKYWLILIALFSGYAVLVKWLMGLLIYLTWTSTIAILNIRKKFSLAPYLKILATGVLSLFIFLPWQIYIHSAFPKEASHELSLNARHFSEVIEDHSESTWFYFTEGLDIMYGSSIIMPFILILGLVLLSLRIRNRKYNLFILSTVGFIYVFYTLAETKMVSFPIIASPFLFLGMGAILSSVETILREKIKLKTVVHSLMILFTLVFAFKILKLTRIQYYHTDWVPEDNRKRATNLYEMECIRFIKKELSDGEYIVFNASFSLEGHIPTMFYTDHVAYGFIPSQKQIDELTADHENIAVVDMGSLPDYITSNEEIKVLTINGGP